MFTYQETTDTCIINNTHKCPLGLDVDPHAPQANSVQLRHNIVTKSGDLHRQGVAKTVQSSLSLDSSHPLHTARQDLPKQMSLPQEAEAIINTESVHRTQGAVVQANQNRKEEMPSAVEEQEQEAPSQMENTQVESDNTNTTVGTVQHNGKPLLRTSQ